MRAKPDTVAGILNGLPHGLVAAIIDRTGRSALVMVCFGRETEFLNTVTQHHARHAQPAGGLRYVAIGFAQGAPDHVAFGLAQ